MRAAAASPAITSASPRAPSAAALPVASPATAAAAASPTVADAKAPSVIALPRVRQVLLEHAVATAALPEGIAGLLAQDEGAGASAGARSNAPEAAPALLTARATDAADASPVLLSTAQSAPPPGPNAAPPAASRREAEATSAQASATDGAGGFLIQIGAYNSQAEAERQLARARTRAPRLLDARAPMTQQVTQGDRQLFRARYGGFAAVAGAAQACQALLRHGIACLVIKGQ
jgi:D-alanyl-D-alanine carboxypeptidase